MSLRIAYGPRGVAKLVQSLSEPSEAADLALNLTTLNGLLSSQENKMLALANDGAVLPVLTGLLSSAEADIRRQAGLAISSLSLVYQGRLAAAEAGTVAALVAGIGDGDATVREACTSALQSLSTSRDGCSQIARDGSNGLVTKLTHAQNDQHKPVVSASTATLANLLRLDLGVEEALSADVTTNLGKLIDPKQRDTALLESSLQALWNLANTPAGKAAAIAADLLDVLAQHIRQGSPNVRRLSAGCVMAITIAKDGKFQALGCDDPLAELLFDEDADMSVVRCAVGALKNMTEYPKVRKHVDKWAKKNQVGTKVEDMFDRVIYDHKPWPASYRYQHQNVAPGGQAAEDEASTRARWGYPQPFTL